MRTVCTILILIAAAWVDVSGDTVKVGKLTYTDANILDVKEGVILFDVAGGRTGHAPLHKVTSLSIDGQDIFNLAEQLDTEGKPGRAVEQYDRALSGVSPWLSRLIRLRRLGALDRAGQIDIAVKEWIALTDESPNALEILKLRPVGLGAKGSAANTKAIELLERKLKSLAPDSIYASRITFGLLELYQHEGHLHSLEAMGIENHLEQVLEIISPKLRSGWYNRDELPAVLLLVGNAEKHLADTHEGLTKQRLLITAGLDFMRIAAFFPNSKQAPEALIAAAKVNIALGNPQAGINAYKKVIGQYPTSPAARIAQSGLAELERRKTINRQRVDKKTRRVHQGTPNEVKAKETVR